MRITTDAAHRGRVAFQMRTFLWFKRHYPALLASEVEMTESEVVRFMADRSKVQPTHRRVVIAPDGALSVNVEPVA